MDMAIQLIALAMHRLRCEARPIGLAELRAAIAAEAGASAADLSDAELREALLAVERSRRRSAVLAGSGPSSTCGGLPQGWVPADR